MHERGIEFTGSPFCTNTVLGTERKKVKVEGEESAKAGLSFWRGIKREQ